ncbi:MAG: ROK family transcriptional regulator [Nitratireductor sp.]|nr:ROK family transcriptional regulator [Nitratireductor sp.]
MRANIANERERVIPITHRGSNQSGMRAYNERLVLTLVRRHGGLAKSDIARMTGLSAQTISVIMRQLEADRLLMRGEPVRGRVGQPSVPLSLNPEGAYFLGLKIGRRSCELVLLDFLGKIVARVSRSYAYPLPDETVEFTAKAIANVMAAIPGKEDRVAGLGIATPFELWNWADEIGVEGNQMEAWRDFDVNAAIAAISPCPVYVQNDATAACAAELAFGDNIRLQDFMYVYVGTFVGGGIVLNGSLYSGRTGNAGALGSMPVQGRDGRTTQLLDHASLVVLERKVQANGMAPVMIWEGHEDWSGIEAEVSDWIGLSAPGLAQAVVAAASVIDFEAVLVDGGFPAGIRKRLIRAIEREISHFDLQGIAVPALREGSLGSVARAMGAASLPLFDRYLIDQNTLMREG